MWPCSFEDEHDLMSRLALVLKPVLDNAELAEAIDVYPEFLVDFPRGGVDSGLAKFDGTAGSAPEHFAGDAVAYLGNEDRVPVAESDER